MFEIKISKTHKSLYPNLKLRISEFQNFAITKVITLNYFSCFEDLFYQLLLKDNIFVKTRCHKPGSKLSYRPYTYLL